MSDMRPIRRGGSLLERAADAYGLDQVMKTGTQAPFIAEPDPAFGSDPGEPAPLPMAFAEDMAPPGAPRIVAAETAASSPVPDDQIAVIDRALLARGGMLVPDAPINALAEEFRLVKRQVLNLIRADAEALGDRARTVLVCSANPNEGKTFSAINLALSLAAERDTEVLLIDADAPKPDVLPRLGLDDRPGLLDVLADPSRPVDDYLLRTDVPHLTLLPAGSRSNQDTELLSSARTEALIDALLAADPRRIIIFDSPPALAASPAATLAHLVGQVLLVVRADVTPESDLREAVQLLDGCERIQLMLNAVSFARGGTRFGSYYGQESPQ